MKKIALALVALSLTASPAFAMKDPPVIRDPNVPQASDVTTNTQFLQKATAVFQRSSDTVKAQVASDMDNMSKQLLFITDAVRTGNGTGYVAAMASFSTSFQRACTTMGGC